MVSGHEAACLSVHSIQFVKELRVENDAFACLKEKRDETKPFDAQRAKQRAASVAQVARIQSGCLLLLGLFPRNSSRLQVISACCGCGAAICRCPSASRTSGQGPTQAEGRLRFASVMPYPISRHIVGEETLRAL